jgi:hypothetical protein
MCQSFAQRKRDEAEREQSSVNSQRNDYFRLTVGAADKSAKLGNRVFHSESTGKEQL